MNDWHRREIADELRELRTDPASGLTSAEAASRLRAIGPNELPEGPPLRPGRIFPSQFASTMVAVYAPPLQGIFRTGPLIPRTLAPCVAASAALFFALEGGKYVVGLARGRSRE